MREGQTYFHARRWKSNCGLQNDVIILPMSNWSSRDNWRENCCFCILDEELGSGLENLRPVGQIQAVSNFYLTYRNSCTQEFQMPRQKQVRAAMAAAKPPRIWHCEPHFASALTGPHLCHVWHAAHDPVVVLLRQGETKRSTVAATLILAGQEQRIEQDRTTNAD